MNKEQEPFIKQIVAVNGVVYEDRGDGLVHPINPHASISRERRGYTPISGENGRRNFLFESVATQRERSMGSAAINESAKD